MISEMWTEVEYAALDFELSGIYSHQPGICEMGGVVVRHGAVSSSRDHFAALVNPMERVSHRASIIHRISEKRMSRAPPLQRWEWSLRRFLGTRIIIAHSAQAEYDGLRKGLRDFPIPLILDTAILAREMLEIESGYGLASLVNRFPVVLKRAERDFDPRIGRAARLHTAYFDALVAGHLFVHLVTTHLPLATVGELAAICEFRPTPAIAPAKELV